MNLREAKQKTLDVLMCVGLLAVTIGLIAYPREMVAAAQEGVKLCFNVIIPSLFPFFVVASLTVELGVAERLGRLLAPMMRPLFNVGGPCASALVLGFVGGYPVGARTVLSLYENGQCTKSEAERMLAFCNNSGPAFIFGVVGAGLFQSSRVGLLLYLAHILASLTVGVIFRGWGSPDIASGNDRFGSVHPPLSEAFVKSVGSSFTSSMSIAGFVIFFTVLIRLLFHSGALAGAAAGLGKLFALFGLDPGLAEALLTGLIELTSGVWSLRDLSGTLTASIAMAAFMLGWAGLSVHCQVLSFIGSSGLSVYSYILGKLLHGVLSAVYVVLLTGLTPFRAPVSAVLAQQVSELSALQFASTLRLSAALAAGLWLVFWGLSRISAKKSGKKRRDAV